jgi:putative ABC transport system permease protein
MLRTYLKIALRNQIKFKTVSFINILGLSIGMACCMLIFLYVQNELSYDKFHENSDRIYRLAFTENRGYKIVNFPITPGAIPPLLKKEFPGIIDAVRIRRVLEPMFIYDEKSYSENRSFFADSSIFDVFSFSLLKGNQETALSEPYSILLTKEIAHKFFGDEDPLGKFVSDGNKNDFKVTGILDKVPPNSHFTFDILLSMSTIDSISEEWRSSSCYSYLLLEKSAVYSELEKKFPAFIQKHRGKEDKRQFYLQPLTKIHLYSRLEREIEANSDIIYITILSAVAVFVLLIACINFMNISTAKSAHRTKEVGVRKVVGAGRKDLVIQFLSESVLISVISFMLGVILIELILPAFNRVTGSALSLKYFGSLTSILGLAAVVFCVGIFSGSYPAFIISSFQSIQTLKGKWIAGRKSSGFRAVLVTLQFSLSIVLIIGTFVMGRQLEYIKEKKLGFKKEHVLVIPVGDRNIQKKYETIKNELLKNPNIVYVTASTAVPGQTINPEAFVPEGVSDKNWIYMGGLFVDSDFIKTMGMEIIEGRDFSSDLKTDVSQALILNEEAVKKLGWESPIGKKLGFPRFPKKTVIGIVRNFHYMSKHRKINPIVLSLLDRDYLIWKISVKIRSEDISKTLAFFKAKWQEFFPHRPANYYFLAEDYDRMYKKEEKLSQIFRYFTYLSLFIACLGLFGMASFMVEQRTKEIGIRKVLGASMTNIFVLLSKEFTKWMMVATLIAWPVAYVAGRLWMKNFAYRVGIGYWVFFLAAALALVIALFTISFQILKAASSNPVESLRYE